MNINLDDYDFFFDDLIKKYENIVLNINGDFSYEYVKELYNNNYEYIIFEKFDNRLDLIPYSYFMESFSKNSIIMTRQTLHEEAEIIFKKTDSIIKYPTKNFLRKFHINKILIT